MISRPQGISYFTGYSGQCAVSFFKSPPFISLALISILYFIILSIFKAPVEKFPESILLIPIAILLVHCFVASRFALPSQNGHFDEGLGSNLNSMEESLACTWRLFMASFVYLIPALFVLYLFPKDIQSSMNHFFYQISIGVEPTLGYSSFLFISSSLFILVFLVYFIPISHLVGLTTTSGLDTWSPSNWAYYLKAKGRESLFFAITLFGSTFLVSLTLGALFNAIGILSLTIFKSISFYQTIMGIYPFICLSSFSVLSGRLSGACIFGANKITSRDSVIAAIEGINYNDTSNKLIDQFSPPNYASEQPPQYSNSTDQISLDMKLKTLSNYPLDEFDRANALLNEILTITPLNLKLSQAQTALYMKYEKVDLALDSVSTTIALALQTGASRLALDTYLALDSLRLKLTLEPAIFERLGPILSRENHYRDAVWCYYQYGKISSEMEKAESLVLEVAKTAEKKLNPKAVLPLYRFILKYFPETSHRAYIEKVIEYNKAK